MRKIYIDYLRTFAAAAVVMIHVTGGVYAQFGTIDPLSWWLANIFNVASRVAVPIFVMISGAVLLGKEMTAVEFYRKRAVRLLPPLIFWNIIYILFKVWLGMDRKSLFQLLTTELWTEGKAYVHLWYLTMFSCLMLFVPFINKFVRGEKPKSNDFLIFIFIVALFFLLDTFSDMMRELNGSHMYWHLAVKWYIAYFIIGYAVDSHENLLKINQTMKLAAILLMLFVGSLLNYVLARKFGKFQDYLVMSNTGIITFFSSILFFSFFKEFSFCKKKIGITRAVSENSFGIYLIHPIILNRIAFFIEKNNFPEYQYILILFVSTFFVSSLAVSILRKNAILRRVC